MLRSASRERGASLIEALVALGVMAFGIMGLTGIQANLRTNSDLAKQRSEAVRIAQQMMEDRRGFVVITTDGVNPAYDGIVTATLGNFAGTNASFSRNVTVTDLGSGRGKNIVVSVQWTDRVGETQSVVLSSTIVGNSPELSASLGTIAPGGSQRLPAKRHQGVPRAAIDQGDGSSRFELPGGSGKYWIFNNATGVITQRCLADDTCDNGKALLLAGFVRFATGNTQPSSVDAELPSSPVITGVGVEVVQTSPESQTVGCFEDASSFAGAVAYYCAVPITDDTQNWTGRSRVSGLDLAGSDSDDDDDEFRVCRYTRDLAHTAVGSGSPPMTNKDHPRTYVAVDAALTNQNFLVIRAGDDSDAFTCPDDNSSTPFVSGRTYKHQPD